MAARWTDLLPTSEQALILAPRTCLSAPPLTSPRALPGARPGPALTVAPEPRHLETRRIPQPQIQTAAVTTVLGGTVAAQRTPGRVIEAAVLSAGGTALSLLNTDKIVAVAAGMDLAYLGAAVSCHKAFSSPPWAAIRPAAGFPLRPGWPSGPRSPPPSAASPSC